MTERAAATSTSTTDLPRVGAEDDPRALAGAVVHALYRVVKGCFLHDDGNQALLSLFEGLTEAVRAYCAKSRADSAAVLFASNSVFVNRQMLRASRETYQLALELGTTLLPCRITEVAIDPSVTPAEIGEFGRAVAEAHRDRKVNPKFGEGGWTHLRTRRVLGLGAGEFIPPVTRVARTYAASIMILRSFYTDLRGAKYELSHSMKRVAQKIAGALEDEKRLFISTAATPPSDTDRAGIAVSSAILATQIAAQLTDDRSILTNLAMAALLYDAPRVCFANAAAGDIKFERALNEDEEERLPTVSLITLTAVGKLHAPSITRSVLVYEALSLRSDATPPYGGARTPHLLSRILHVARAFAEMRVARGAFAPLSIDDAIDVLNSQAADNTSRTLVKLLVGVLGVFPTGTLVELSSGELAVVTASPKLPIDFARPSVRVLYDSNARLLDAPIDVDLAQQGAAQQRGGVGARLIRKAIDATDQQMKQMRAYVMNLNVRKEEVSPARTAVTTPPPGMLSVPRSSARAEPAASRAPAPASREPEPRESQRRPEPTQPSVAPVVSSAAPISITTRDVPPASDASRRSPTLRPQMTRKWDPRMEDDAAGSAPASVRPPPSRKPTPAPAPVRTPTPPPVRTPTPSPPPLSSAPSPRTSPGTIPGVGIRVVAPTLQSTGAPRSTAAWGAPRAVGVPPPLDASSPLREKTPVSGEVLREGAPNATRQVNWDTFGRERMSSKPPTGRADTPPTPRSAADEILAAYLSEVEQMAVSSPGRDYSSPASRGSGGLRWGDPKSSHGEPRSSQGAERRSSHGEPRSSQGAERRSSHGEPRSSQGVDRRSFHGEPRSSQGEPRVSSARGPTQVPPSGEIESNRKTAPPPATSPEDAPVEPSPASIAGPNSGRAKAGNQGWGTPRRERK